MESIFLYFVVVILPVIFLGTRTVFFGYIFKRKKLVSNRHGGELVAEVLREHNVKHVFTLIGGHISPVVVAAEKAGVKVIDTRHEVTAVFAADAVARLTGTIGVAVVTAGPGVTNTITAVKNAQMAQSPVLLIGGSAPTLLKGRGALQDIDQLSLFKTLCKDTKSVRTVRDIKPVLRKAIQTAMSDTPGPVFVELPVDVLYPLPVVEKEVLSTKGGKSLVSRIVNWYLDWHVYNMFVDGFDYEDSKKPLPVKVPVASETQVKKCLELLSKSARPVMIVGSQAMLPAASVEALRKAVDTLQIPCFLGGMSRGLLGKNHLLQLRHTRKQVLKEADLVILAGATCDFRLTYGKVLSKSSKIVVINRSRKQMLQNSDMFWKPTLSVQGCISDFLIRLSNMKVPSMNKEWLLSLIERDVDKEIKIRESAVTTTLVHLNPLELLCELDKSLSDNTILIADGGDFVATASYIVRPRGPLKWLDPGPFGTLGVGAGFALGAKVCNPTADVVILYGDGSLGYSLIEFDTFFRHKLPVVAIVGNDACWSQIAREQAPLFQSRAGCDLEYSDYHLAVEGIGGKGFLLKSDDSEKLLDIFKDALSQARQGQSVLVNALISRSSFREGSISV